MQRGIVLPVFGAWVILLITLAWTFIVMMGQTSTQGGRVSSWAFTAVLIPVALALVAALALLRRVHTIVGFQPAWWLALVPALVLAYFGIAMAINMFNNG